MQTTAITLAVFLSALGLCQFAITWKFCRLFRTRRLVESHANPKAAILMALRGADPQLRETITRLVQQDYPNFDLHIVVDRREDPGWRIVQEVMDELQTTNVTLNAITNRRTTCGLQCSALIEAAGSISDDTEIIITVDGDLIAHPDMLHELIAPFSDDEVGLTFGNRWFMPRRPNFGSLVRYSWNCAAIVPMHFLSIPWGGCMAIRRSVFDRCNIADQWSRAMVHDAPIKSSIGQLGLRAEFVPSLMMPIQESCDLRFVLDFVKRQLTWTRLYHHGWGFVPLQAAITTGLPLIGLIFVLVALFSSSWWPASIVGIALIAYAAVLWALNLKMESAIQNAFAWRNERTKWMSAFTISLLPFAIVGAQLIQTVALCLASFNKHVLWRGVLYRINGPWDAKILHDAPFEQDPASDKTL